MATHLYGRGQEQQRIDLLLGAAHSHRSGALLLCGGPGTGKSALLEYALGKASDMRLLRCQGDLAEADLPYAALHQLLQPVLPIALELPRRLAAPLIAALGQDAGEVEPDRFLVCAAVHELLATAARRRPLLCVVDDAQWLDPPSALALSFAARRMHWGGVAMLVAVRDGEGRPFQPAGVAARRLDALDPVAAARLLAERAGPHLVPEVARRLVEETGGVPLALVDATASLTPRQLAGGASLPQPLPLSPRVRTAFLRRARRRPQSTQRLLLVVASAGEERIDVVVAAGERLGVELSALDDAEASGLLRIEDGIVRFSSRLVHSAVYHDASFFERRDAHLALAQALGDDEEDRRAWHLAAAAVARDGRLATELERSAERAGLRGGLGAKADTLQRAAELTPDGPERGRRLVAAARACWLGGRSIQAGELLDRTAGLRLDPLDQADISALRGRIELCDYDLEAAVEALTAGADRVAAASPTRALDLLVRAGEVVVAACDADGARCIARCADALPGGMVEGAELLRGAARVLAGHFDEAARLAEWTIALAGIADERGAQLAGLATMLSAGNDLAPASVASALHLLTAEVGRQRANGAAGALPTALASLAWLELWADRHRSCAANASEGLSRARELGQQWSEASCAMTLAMLAALRGHEHERETLAEVLLRPPGAQSAALHAGAAVWAAALSDLGAGRFAESLTRLDDLAPDSRFSHPWHTLWSRPDAVEAAVRSGQPKPARTALAVLEGAWHPGWPAPAAALLARSRALLATGAEAERHYLAALELHAAEDRPFQHARTRLLWGEHLRRSRRRLDAREQLRAAIDAFERLDARPWAARAAAELRATGETVRRRHEDLDGLTPQEVRIAHLVAQGGSNREVAEQLFLSPRTVGYHLARIYRKLGVTSRTRLAHLLREDELAGGHVRRGLSPRAKEAFRSRPPSLGTDTDRGRAEPA